MTHMQTMTRDEQAQATLAADLELLRELAEAATPGPWETSTSEATMNDRSGYRFGPRNKPLVFRADQMRAADAAYIAAVSPDAVLALLDETTELRSIVADRCECPNPEGITPAREARA